jgi:hypothetical protein
VENPKNRQKKASQSLPKASSADSLKSVNFDGLQLVSALNVETKDWAKEALSRLSEASLG